MKRENYSPEELLPIVAELAASYTGDEHSSISYEKAGQLMEAVLYCIEEVGEENFAIVSNKMSAKTAYECGKKIVTEKCEELLKLHNRLSEEFCDYGMKCLRETFEKGIPAFLRCYDVKYAPQENILILDYPVLKNLNSLCGVDKILEYVKCIAIEQRFLNSISENFIIHTLRAYHSKYEYLVENIFEIVLSNIVGYIILQKPVTPAGLTKADYDRLEKNLLLQSYHFEEFLRGLLEKIFRSDSELWDYISLSIGNMAVRFQTALENHCLSRIYF